MSDVMIDLETLGTAPDSAILSIGMARFDRKTGEIFETLYLKIAEPELYGGASKSTLAWWAEQDPLVRAEAFSGDTQAKDAAASVSRFLKESDCVWGNGATFDISMLEWWVSQFSVRLPFKFWNVRDVRTVIDLSGLNYRSIPFEGDRHNALADAIHQAKYTSQAIQLLVK